MAYAEGTSVAPERSRAEIEATLKRYGASHFGYMSSPEGAMVGFQVNKYQVRFSVPMPALAEFKRTDKGRTRTDIQAREALDKEERRRWRALALCVKAKLEAVDSGITTFEQEFMAHIVIPGSGATVGESLLPRLAKAIEEGKPSGLLLDWNPK